MPVDETLASKDPAELSEEEARQLALQRSSVSLDDFNPAADDDQSNRVVELPDRGSAFVRDLVDHPDPNIATDAQGAVAGTNPGGPNYPHGPGEDSAVAQPQSRPAQPLPGDESPVV